MPTSQPNPWIEALWADVSKMSTNYTIVVVLIIYILGDWQLCSGAMPQAWRCSHYLLKL